MCYTNYSKEKEVPEMFEIEMRLRNGSRLYKGEYDNPHIALKKAKYLRKLVTPYEAEIVIIDTEINEEAYV